MNKRNILILAINILGLKAVEITSLEINKQHAPKICSQQKSKTKKTQKSKAQIGSFGFDSTGMDKSVEPGDDFYTYANGTWAQLTPIPSDKSNFSVDTVLDELSKRRMKYILNSAKNDPDSKIGTAYASYLDETCVKTKGLSPIKPWLTEIKALKDKAAYPALAGKAARADISGLFHASVEQDDKDPKAYILKISQSGLGLPDRDYYLIDNDKMKAIRAAYVSHLQKMFDLAHESNASNRAAALMAFETEIAKVHWNLVDSRDADKTYNKMTITQLTDSALGFDFISFFATNGISPTAIVVAQPSSIIAIASLIAHTPLSVIQDALLIRSLDRFANFLPENIAKENFAFYGTILTGTPKREKRWKRAVNFVKDILGEELGKIYVAKYFPQATKKAMDKLVDNVIAAMGRRIDGLDWMDAKTKIQAHKKLAAFTPKIGYPDRWRNYSDLTIKKDDLFGNALRSNQFDYDYNAGKLGKSIYYWEWQMTPMEVNAYADFSMIEIVFPAALLQPPFFDPNADPAVNYGAIGGVIGHELSHHFDDQGAKYDYTGKLQQWWTEADITNFKILTDKLIKQYDAYEPLPGVYLNGALTLGENIGDLAGLAIALDAYHASLEGEPAPVIDGTTGDQRFFLGWAQAWRRNYREQDLRQRLVTDPHSPSQYRTNIVRNFDSWYDAFSPKETDKIYLKPEDRIKIW